MLKRFQNLTAFQISMISHIAIGLLISVAVSDLKFKKYKKINFQVIENPVITPPNLNLQIKKQTEPTAPPKPEQVNSQKVFGASRKSITTTKADAISVKQGNTVAKENDDLKLQTTDADSLPIPADDYLVTSNVKLISVVVANRTDMARKAGYTGTAVLLILIDREGAVREVKLLNQLEFGLDEKAIEIAKNLKFIPAKINDAPVATKIRFSINFKSSN